MASVSSQLARYGPKPKVANYQLTKKAKQDLSSIARYTIKSFGIQQSRHYRNSIERCFEALRRNPDMGRSSEELAPGLRCFEHQSHVIYYMPRESGPLIARILHRSMNVTNHL